MMPARRGLALRCLAAARSGASSLQAHRMPPCRNAPFVIPSCRLLVHHSKEGQMNRIMTLGVGCLVLVGAGCADDAASPTRPSLLTATQPAPPHPAGVIH